MAREGASEPNPASRHLPVGMADGPAGSFASFPSVVNGDEAQEARSRVPT